MRLHAKEDEVYHLMDLKEWFSVLIGLGSFLEGIALYFFIFRIRAWDLAYLCVALALSIIFFCGRLPASADESWNRNTVIWNWNQIALPSASRRKMEDMSPAVFFIRK